MPTRERRLREKSKLGDAVSGLRLRHSVRGGVQPTYPSFEVYGYERLHHSDTHIREFTKNPFWCTRVLRVSMCFNLLNFEVFDRGPACLGKVLMDSHDRSRVSATIDTRDFEEIDPFIHVLWTHSKGMSRESFVGLLWYGLNRFKGIPRKILEWMPELEEDYVQMQKREKVLEAVPLPRASKK